MNLSEHLSDTNRGSYLDVEGRPALRFRRTYPHPVEKVWAAVSTPNRLSFTWYDDEVHLELDAEDSGCVLTLTNVLSEKDGAARNGAGWSVCLGELTRHLDGVPDTDPVKAGTDLWQPLYEAYAAAGLPAGAAIPES
jgi:uncharacterized protein YndB with AHSA1/START domain